MTSAASIAIEDTSDVVAEDYWAKKGDVDLYMHRKYKADSDTPRPVLVLVHGSSQAARTSVDLDIPGHGEYSTMKTFARLGYDVWTMDHEGYGKSSRTEGYSYILDGVEDLKAAIPIIEKETGQSQFAFFGSSSGALRAGAYQNACPERVERIALSAFPYTGKDAPSLIKRALRLDEWQATNSRQVDAEYFKAMVTRDIVGLTVPELPEIAAAAEMANGGGSVPNGTYIDMCINLPIIDPAKFTCPVLMLRAEHDGITTNEDMADFYAKLATLDKQIVQISGQAHNMTFGINRHRFWHALLSFLEMPARLDSLQA